MHSLMILAINSFYKIECHLIYDILWLEEWALNGVCLKLVFALQVKGGEEYIKNVLWYEVE